MGLPQRDSELHTYRDYCGWAEDVRYELIDGVAYVLSADPEPAPVLRHQEVTFELARIIAEALDGSPCRPYIAPFDVRLPCGKEVDDGVDMVVQPDISVICDKSKLDERGCRGAPEWVIEVLSPSTAGHDQVIKRALYERVGVREFWLVHPVDRVVTIYVLENGAYGKPLVYELIGDLAAVTLPQVRVVWEKVLRED